METYGKFVSVKSYHKTGAWKNPELSEAVRDLREKEIVQHDLKTLYSLGVFSVETTKFPALYTNS